MKNVALIIYCNLFVVLTIHAQSYFCNTTGGFYKNSRYQIDTIKNQFPQIEILEPQIYDILDSLLGDLCEHIKEKNEMPYYGEISVNDRERNKITFELSNSYFSPQSNAEPWIEALSEVNKKIIGTFKYKDVNFYLLDLQLGNIGDYNDLYKISNSSIESEVYIIYGYHRRKLLPVMNHFNFGYREYNFSNGQIEFVKKSWSDW